MWAAEGSTLKAVALDVDGVLTDNGFWWGTAGEELKRFDFADVMGIARTLKLGIGFALISGEDTAHLARYANKLGIAHVWAGSKDKAASLREFAQRLQVAPRAIAFMGNDINDIEAMQQAGLAAAPADAHPLALRAARFVSQRPGGHGAVRELLDALWLAPELHPSHAKHHTP